MSQMLLIDSHCHLQDERFGSGPGAVIERAQRVGVERMVCCAARTSDWDRLHEITQDYPTVIPFFGLHPWFLDSAPLDWFDDLHARLLSVPSGIGEVGLDFGIDNVNRIAQEKAFRLQLRMANLLHRPLSIHCCKALHRLSEILSEEGLRCSAAIHGYSGPVEMVPSLEQMGLYLSFSAAVISTRNSKVRESVIAVSPQHLLIETDSPYMPPENSVSSVNEPANLVRIVETIAGLRGTTAEEIASITRDNAIRYLGTVAV